MDIMRVSPGYMMNILSWKTSKLILTAVAAISLFVGPAVAQESDDIRMEIQAIKKQLADMDTLKARLDELEKKLEESEKARAEMQKAQESQNQPLTTSFKNVRARVDGRIFAGIFDSGEQGAADNWSTDISDARLRFTFIPSQHITVVNRLRTSGADVDGFDYFYLDYTKIPLPDGILRVGQRKIDVGQETWGDNPVENILISNSISSVSGYGIGVALRGRLSESKTAPLYELGYVNGARGVTRRPTTSIPFNIKLGVPMPQNLFASASYFDSGRLGADDDSAISVANITSAPSGASEWSRKIWEVDLRYNYGPEGVRAIIPSTDLPRTMAGVAYGVFYDDATGVPDRDGSYWFVEGLHNLSDYFYAAARYSTVDLKNDVLAGLGRSPVPVNSYTRISLGLGYRLSTLTDLKTEYSINNTSGGASEPSLNQWAIGFASKF